MTIPASAIQRKQKKANLSSEDRMTIVTIMFIVY